MIELLMRRRDAFPVVKVWNIIEFEDSVFKDICVTNWGGVTGAGGVRGVAGEITVEQAAKVTSMSGKLKNKSTLTIVDFSKFTSLTSIEQWALQGSKNVTKFVMPYTIKTLGANLVYTQRHNILFIVGDEENGSNLTTINGTSFGQARAVVLYKDTPPTVSGSTGSLKNVQNVYVPDDSVDTYKAHSVWGAAPIKGISQFVG